MPFPSNHLKYLQGSQAYLSCICGCSVANFWWWLSKDHCGKGAVRQMLSIANIKCGHPLNSMQSAGCMLPRVPLWYHRVFLFDTIQFFSLIPSSFSLWYHLVFPKLFSQRWNVPHGNWWFKLPALCSRFVGSPNSVRTAPCSLFSSFALLLC